MANSKKTFLVSKILFVYLILFPFGQLMRFSFNLLGGYFVLHAIDILAFVSLLIYISDLVETKKLNSLLVVFILSNIFSLAVSTYFFGLRTVFVGVMYFVRLISHMSIYYSAFLLIKKNKNVELIPKYLITLSTFIAIFGWIQYFAWPDITGFKIWGWDDHLYRIVGSFLDPTFTSLFLVLGSILVLREYLKNKNFKFFILFIFLIVGVAFCYSRAGYISLLVSHGFLLFRAKKLKTLLAFCLMFLAIIFALPRPGGEGVRLERTKSISLRIENYIETAVIVKTNPLFGVGYNNLCIAKKTQFPNLIFGEHSCSGADSSILFLFSTIGGVGLIFFVLFIWNLVQKIPKGGAKDVVTSLVLAVVVHSQFANSLFYPWVVGWFGLVFAWGLSLSPKMNSKA